MQNFDPEKNYMQKETRRKKFNSSKLYQNTVIRCWKFYKKLDWENLSTPGTSEVSNF